MIRFLIGVFNNVHVVSVSGAKLLSIFHCLVKPFLSGKKTFFEWNNKTPVSPLKPIGMISVALDIITVNHG
jgi:hypothetical protein